MPKLREPVQLSKPEAFSYPRSLDSEGNEWIKLWEDCWFCIQGGDVRLDPEVTVTSLTAKEISSRA